MNGLLPKRRWTRLLLVATLAALSAGGAFAYFTTAGSGSASGQVGTVPTVSITPAVPTTSLYPGGDAEVAATFDNPNDTVAHVASLALDTSQGTNGFSVDAGHSGCDLSALHFTATAQDNGGSGWDVPAKAGADDGSTPISLADAVSMDDDAANACQGASFRVYLKAGS